MISTTLPLTVAYRIDASNRITWVNEAWSQFANANQGGAVLPEAILGQNWESSVSDSGVRQLYRSILEQVRDGKVVQFDYRCDAPDRRRTFAMTVSPIEDGAVEFVSALIHEEARPTVALLQEETKRNENFVIVCSWCQRVKVADQTWVSVEEAVAQLHLFESEAQPRLSHGICTPCCDKMMARLNTPLTQDGAAGVTQGT